MPEPKNQKDMTCFDKCVFDQAIDHLAHNYPNRDLKLVGNLVYCDGEAKFNTAGYNLLYCLQQLVRCLEDELI